MVGDPGAGIGGRVRDASGITLTEVIIALTLIAIGSAMSYGSFFQYQQSVSTSRAARAISSDVQLAKSLAIRGREPVSLVADEAQLQYVIRDTLGTQFMRRDFGSGSDMPLTGLDVAVAGDSLTFDPRGILLTGGTPTVTVTRHGKARTVTMNGLGRTRVN